MPPADTIFALSSAPGRAAIAVVRVSGPEAASAIQALTHRPAPEARRASLRDLFPPSRSGSEAGEVDRVAKRRETEGVIDQSLVLFFPAPHSATGENVAEFHVHGGRAVMQAVLGALAAVPGLRPAERGEFTRRAVENGRLDLTQAEGLADLIDAETDAQRAQALAHYGGALLQRCEDWRARLIRVAAWAEAAIDFADEELDSDLDARMRDAIAGLRDEIRSALADNRRGEAIREGFHLAVVGPPNAGKSSLVNALAQRDVAIVSDIPGTTRDVLEARLDLDGYLVTVADTAGLRNAGEAIEAEGVRRALARADAADLVLLVLDGSANDPYAELPNPANALSLAPSSLSWPATAGHPGGSSASLPGWPGLRSARPGHDRNGEERVFIVWNKADLAFPAAREGLQISVATGEGLDALRDALSQRVHAMLEAGDREAPAIARLRHRAALEEAVDSLSRALDSEAPELTAENLRLALRATGRVTGRVDVEDLLDVIFRDFCIGK